MARKILLIFVVYFSTLSSSLLALGLGEIKLKSGLNQPLNAEISLLSIRGENNYQLKGALGSSEAFIRSGIERSFFLTKIKFKTITKPNGSKVLQLTTRQAVKEPFLNFLVDLEWPNGKLLREYTVLLDPPIFDDSPRTIVKPAQREVVKQSRPVVSKPRIVKEQWQGDIYGPTSSNDTLWGIASKVKPRGVTTQQAMLTIFETNPKAFMKGNINNLMRGAELKIPEQDVFSQISQREALRMIAAHNDNWKSGRRTAPRVVMDTSSNYQGSNDGEATSADSGRLSLLTEDSTEGKAGSSGSSLIVEEENEVLKQENENLSQQSQADAEKIIQLERLLELKDAQLANIQNREDESVIESETSVNQSDEIQQINADAVESTTEKPTLVTPVETKSFIDKVMEGVYNLYLGIGALLLIILVFFIRRKQNEDDYQEENTLSTKDVERVSPSIETADEVLADTEIAETTYIEPENSAPQSTEEDSDSIEASDPLGEADIYLAYGKYEQAESLLLMAIDSNPGQLELSGKLLECYAEMDEKLKFEAHLESVSEESNIDEEFTGFADELHQQTWPEQAEHPVESLIEESAEIAYEAPYEAPYESKESAELVLDEEEEFTFEDDFEIENTQLEENHAEDELASEELPSTEDVFGENEEDLDPDLDVLDENLEENLDEDDVETQLDLARAYVEMGDIDGTKEIIKEIMENGSDAQCEDAQSILDSLSS